MNDDEKKSNILKDQIQIGDEKSEAISHKDASLKRLDTSFLKHITLQEYKKTHLLAYWLNDFAQYHDEESTFSPSSLKVFKKGDIIKVNLGFNIGNELGGLHYCIVLNKKDNKKSGTLNIIPLSSAKKTKSFNENTCIDLGDELYFLLKDKFDKEYSDTKNALNEALQLTDIPIETIQKLSQRIEYLQKIYNEITKMKHGSYALVHQITTISKQRIFKTPILSGIRVSNDTLDLLDDKIKKLFLKNN